MSPQELLARMLTDPPLAEELRADPVAFAESHGVDPGTARQLAGLPDAGFRLTASITRQMRESRIAASYPGTFASAAGTAHRAALLRAAGERGTLNRPADSLDIGHRLAAAAEALPTDPGTRLLRELIVYETLCHKARVLAAEPAPPPGPPALGHGVVLAAFDRPMAEVRRLVVEGRQAGEPPAGATWYLLRASAGSPRVRAHRPPPKLADLLSACDGVRTVAAVAFAARLPLEAARRTLHTMAAKGFVSWDPDEAEAPRDDPAPE